MGKNLTEPPLPEGQRLLSEELNELGYLRANKEKCNIEFNRYKQDCRKRALDLAHSEWSTSTIRSASTLNQSNLAPTVNVIALADKYYEWLVKEV